MQVSKSFEVQPQLALSSSKLARFQCNQFWIDSKVSESFNLGKPGSRWFLWERWRSPCDKTKKVKDSLWQNYNFPSKLRIILQLLAMNFPLHLMQGQRVLAYEIAGDILRRMIESQFSSSIELL